ncbi:MAG: PDZ domain-containing protein [Kiritimatiellia bacterium]
MKRNLLTPSLCAAALLGLAASTTGCASYRGRRAAQDFQQAVSAAADNLRPSSVIVRVKPRDSKPVEDAGGGGGMIIMRGGAAAGAPPELFGAVLDDQGRIVIPAVIKPAESRLFVVIDGEEQDARFLASDEALGMTLLQAPLPPGARALDLTRQADPAPGQWLVTLARGDEASDFEPRVATPICSGTTFDRYRSFVVTGGDSRSTGAPVATLDGDLAGFAGRDGVLALSDVRGELQSFLQEASVPRNETPKENEERDRKEGVVRLGILTRPLNSDLALTRDLPRRSLLVTALDPKGCASAAGLKPGDIITGLNGGPLRFRDDAMQSWFARAVKGREGAPFQLSILRDGKPLDLAGTLTRLPEPEKMLARDIGITVAELDEVTRFSNNVPDGTRGVVITDVRAGSPAYVAADDQGGKLRKNDILLELNGQPVPAITDFRRELLRQQAHPSDYVLLKILRGRVTLYVALNIRQNPSIPVSNGTP